MNITTAREIVSKCTAHVWHQMGLAEEVPPSLQEYSLADLVEANRLVRDDEGEPQPDGTLRMQVCCGDRLIAALYVLYHYPAQDADGEELEPIATARGCAVLVLKMGKGGGA